MKAEIRGGNNTRRAAARVDNYYKEIYSKMYILVMQEDCNKTIFLWVTLLQDPIITR